MLSYPILISYEKDTTIYGALRPFLVCFATKVYYSFVIPTNQSILTSKIQEIAIVIMPRHYITRLLRGDITLPDTSVQSVKLNLQNRIQSFRNVACFCLATLVIVENRAWLLTWYTRLEVDKIFIPCDSHKMKITLRFFHWFREASIV